MAGVNKIILLGRLGKDPELKQVGSQGSKVVNFSVATSENFKNKDGEKQEKTEWHNCQAWNKTADLVAQYLKKGSQVYLEGKLQTRSYDDNEGTKKYVTEIVVNNVQFLSKSENREVQSNIGGNVQDEQAAFSSDNDIPFKIRYLSDLRP